MAYVPNPVDVTQPTEDKFAKTAAAEFRALKAYIQSIVSGGGPGAIPPGSIWEFPLINAPAGFLVADGSLILRSAFPNLFAIANADGLVTEVDWANSNWGCFAAGDGATTFRIPDFRGEYRRGAQGARGLPTAPAVRGVFQDGTVIRTTPQEWSGSDTIPGPFTIGITSKDFDQFFNAGGGPLAGAVAGAGPALSPGTADQSMLANAENNPSGSLANNYIKMKPRTVSTLVCIKT